MLNEELDLMCLVLEGRTKLRKLQEAVTQKNTGKNLLTMKVSSPGKCGTSRQRYVLVAEKVSCTEWGFLLFGFICFKLH